MTPPVTSNPSPDASGFQVVGTNADAPFSLKLHRGDGMTLVAMNWKVGRPPDNFVGFAIEYQEPGGSQFFALNNRLNFLDASGNVNPQKLPTLQSPIQKFRWVHFPRNAELAGDFIYRVTPMFMDAQGKLSKGEPQQAPIQLARETYPGIANVTFTRGFVSSQAFVDRYLKNGPINTLVAPRAAGGLDFKPTHPDTQAALAWMGFEARAAILETLDQAIADHAEVRVVAYDFNLPELLDRLVQLGPLLKIIIDDSDKHGEDNSAETKAESRLVASAGRDNVWRQHMSNLQHNKTIAVNGPTVKKVVFGSTNLSWRGFYVQANNALVVTGQKAVDLAFASFNSYVAKSNSAAGFGATPSADWQDLGLPGIDVKVAFSPHSAANAKLDEIATDLKSTTSSLLYSLAFLFQTGGEVREAIDGLTEDSNVFVYGISDKEVGGIDVQDPNGNVAPVFAEELGENVPEPFKSEPTGGTGTRMHHKFTVIDFDKPTARVYLGSYNFSEPADRQNGENLLIVRDRRIAVSYMVEALSIFDHYSFRVAVKKANERGVKLHLARPPGPGEKPWFEDDFTVGHKIKDRLLFS
ncbi:phospholipase D-like domain-containing protein [Bradyrhizobium sp. LMG 9283]|uniref:phospholipase D-like domain-containing protein n=1 Tax=Bradyrhizobium sp. LMG 9283 TaxID=592064 RepID=UPI00388F028B